MLSGLGRVGPERGEDIPGQKFRDSIDGMHYDLGQDSAEVELRIEPIQLGGADETIKRRSSFTA